MSDPAERPRLPGDRSPETLQGRRVNVTAQTLSIAVNVPGPESAKLQQALIHRTIAEEAGQAQDRMQKAQCLNHVDRALGGIANLPQTIQNQWRSQLELLRTLATRQAPNGRPGDPYGILRLSENLRPQRELLRKFAQTDTDPLAVRAALDVEEAFRAYERAIGEPHTAVNVRSPPTNADVNRQGREIVQIGTFLVAGSIGAIFGTLELLKGNGERSLKMPGAYLAVAALAAGWGSLTETGSERLDSQISFLTQIDGEWERLQRSYGLRGPEWKTFVEGFYREVRQNSNPTLIAALRSSTPLTPEQRAAVHRLAPATASQQFHDILDKMLNSGPASNAADLRVLAGFLDQATTPDARTIVARYVGSGASRQSLAMLNSATASTSTRARPPAPAAAAGVPPLAVTAAPSAMATPPSAPPIGTAMPSTPTRSRSVSRRTGRPTPSPSPGSAAGPGPVLPSAPASPPASPGVRPPSAPPTAPLTPPRSMTARDRFESSWPDYQKQVRERAERFNKNPTIEGFRFLEIAILGACTDSSDVRLTGDTAREVTKQQTEFRELWRQALTKVSTTASGTEMQSLLSESRMMQLELRRFLNEVERTFNMNNGETYTRFNITMNGGRLDVAIRTGRRTLEAHFRWNPSFGWFWSEDVNMPYAVPADSDDFFLGMEDLRRRFARLPLTVDALLAMAEAIRANQFAMINETPIEPVQRDVMRRLRQTLSDNLREIRTRTDLPELIVDVFGNTLRVQGPEEQFLVIDIRPGSPVTLGSIEARNPNNILAVGSHLFSSAPDAIMRELSTVVADHFNPFR